MFRTEIRWHKIHNMHESALSVKPLVQYIAGRKICLLKTEKGLYAIEDKCPHNGFSLSKGWCTEDGGAIVCPLHRFAFNLENGRALTTGGAARVYPLEQREDGLFIGIKETIWGF
ncbi:MAG: hypothetical protein Fur0041_22340 [Bacteroidia bacterium]